LSFELNDLIVYGFYGPSNNLFILRVYLDPIASVTNHDIYWNHFLHR